MDYQRARAEHDQRINQELKTIFFQRIIICLVSSILLISFVFLFWSVSQPKLIPYVVSITNNEEVKFKGIISRGNLEITDTMARFQLRRFINSMRSVSIDIPFQKKQISEGLAMVTKRGQNDFYKYAIKDGLKNVDENGASLSMAENEIWRTIHIVSLEKIADRSWRAEWEETTRFKNGDNKHKLLSGIFNFSVQHIDNIVMAESNPFGIFFDTFSFNAIKRTQS